MRRFDSDSPRRRDARSIASVDVVEIVERLAHAHEDDVGDRAHAFARGHEPVASAASRPGKVAEPVARDDAAAPTISSAVRLRTSFCVPVWQKVQFSVQPTWLETQSVPRSLSGM